MDEASSYPPIEPNTFDLIVVGTGLPESLIAAAAFATRKNVINLDPNPYYGGRFTSLSIFDLTTFLKLHFSIVVDFALIIFRSPAPRIRSHGDSQSLAM